MGPAELTATERAAVPVPVAMVAMTPTAPADLITSVRLAAQLVLIAPTWPTRLTLVVSHTRLASTKETSLHVNS